MADRNALIEWLADSHLLFSDDAEELADRLIADGWVNVRDERDRVFDLLDPDEREI